MECHQFLLLDDVLKKKKSFVGLHFETSHKMDPPSFSPLSFEPFSVLAKLAQKAEHIYALY